MKQLKIVQVGNPDFRKKCTPLTEKEVLSEEIKNLVKEMKYTLRKVGGVGLAAPQVDVHKQICIIRIHPTKYRPNLPEVPVYAMFNPEIIKTSGAEKDGWEGCLSVAEANLFMKVERPQSVAVSYIDEKGQKQKVEKTGLEAVVIQHEIDHLNGLVFLDKDPDLSTAMSSNEYRAMLKKNK